MKFFGKKWQIQVSGPLHDRRRRGEGGGDKLVFSKGENNRMYDSKNLRQFRRENQR